MDTRTERPTPAAAWDFLREARDEDIPLVWAALTLARDEYPGLDVDGYERQVTGLARDLLGRQDSSDPVAGVRAINAFLFDELGFTGNQNDYYDPRNSYLNDVIDRKLGIPISLGVLQIALAQGLGLDMRGVSFPGHFLVSLPVDGGVLVLDPYHRGRSVDLAELKARARPHMGDQDVQDDEVRNLLAPATNRAILARMLRNLKALYAERDDFERALRCADRLLTLDPAQPQELRDRGLLYLRVGHTAAGRDDLIRYLSAQPAADDADQVREILVDAGLSPKRLN
jgi:regulator of sirC expression with transglutaminase-like and TPR domain